MLVDLWIVRAVQVMNSQSMGEGAYVWWGPWPPAPAGYGPADDDDDDNNDNDLKSGVRVVSTGTFSSTSLRTVSSSHLYLFIEISGLYFVLITALIAHVRTYMS